MVNNLKIEYDCRIRLHLDPERKVIFPVHIHPRRPFFHS